MLLISLPRKRDLPTLMTGLVITLLRTKDDAAALVAGIQELDDFKQLLVA